VCLSVPDIDANTVRKIILIITALFFSATTHSEDSICYGTTSNGKLEGGVKLPSEGRNFVSYSSIAETFGRTYVHSKVKEIVVTSYKRLENEMPEKVYKYAETGFKNGGQFKPHKTHRNGLSVDFMVPVMNESGESVHLPTNFSNKLGYSIEFNESGEYKGYKIDYEALSAHIAALHKVAKEKGVGLWRVIFDPKLQPNLLRTKYGAYLQNHIQFSKKNLG